VQSREVPHDAIVVEIMRVLVTLLNAGAAAPGGDGT
jgi:hypothetical protein